MAITVGTYASIPGSPSSGDVHFLTDSFYNLLYYNGANSPASWDHFLHGKLLTPPPSFTWINQGTATVSSTNGGEHMNAPSAGGSVQFRIRKKSAPSTPYTVTSAILPTIVGRNITLAGVCFRESSTGKTKYILAGFHSSYTYGSVIVGFNGTTDHLILRIDTLISSPLIFWRLEDDGANRKYYFSGDGINFVQIYSEGRTTDMTANEIGWLTLPYNQDTLATLIHWKEA